MKVEVRCVKCGNTFPGKANDEGVIIPEEDDGEKCTKVMRDAVCALCHSAGFDRTNYGGPAAWIAGEPMDEILIENYDDPALKGIEVIGSFGTGTPDYMILVPVTFRFFVWLRDRAINSKDEILLKVRDQLWRGLRSWRHRVVTASGLDVEVWLTNLSSDTSVVVNIAPVGDWIGHVAVHRGQDIGFLLGDGVAPEKKWKVEIGVCSQGMTDDLDYAEALGTSWQIGVEIARYLRAIRGDLDYDRLIEHLCFCWMSVCPECGAL